MRFNSAILRNIARYLRTIGILRSTVLFTLISMALSHAICILIAVVTGNIENYIGRDAFMATFVPLLVSPPMAFVVLSLLLEIERLRQHLELLSEVDPLTGVANRRRFTELGDHAHSVAVDKSQPLTLLMIDADHFKSINDRFGHHVGDVVLQQIAHRCGSVLRSTDILARIGGEEFVALLPSLDFRDALAIAERLRVRICEDPIVTDGNMITVTVSIGASSVEATGSLHEMMRKADEMLYRAKAQGRNQVAA